MRVHHVGYAVRDIGEAVSAFEALGFSPVSPVSDDVIRNVRLLFMKNGAEVIELVAPLKSSSPVDAILVKAGATPYHLCYVVASIKRALPDLRAKGFKQITKILPACAIDGRSVVFLFNPVVGIIELVEEKES